MAHSLFAAAPQDPLWRKAVTVSRENAGWVPGLVVMRNEMLHDGKPEGVHEVWQRSKLGTNGQIVSETIKVLEDGKDITTKEKDQSQLVPANAIGSSLFNPKLQDQVVATPTARTREITGQQCAGYEFEQKTDKGPTLRGTAWLEKETGRPVELEKMTFDPLPDKHIKKMTIIARYGSTPESGWQLKETVMDSVVGILLIKADVRSTMTFSEYWKKPRRRAVAATPKNAED